MQLTYDTAEHDRHVSELSAAPSEFVLRPVGHTATLQVDAPASTRNYAWNAEGFPCQRRSAAMVACVGYDVQLHFTILHGKKVGKCSPLFYRG